MRHEFLAADLGRAGGLQSAVDTVKVFLEWSRRKDHLFLSCSRFRTPFHQNDLRSVVKDLGHNLQRETLPLASLLFVFKMEEYIAALVFRQSGAHILP